MVEQVGAAAVLAMAFDLAPGRREGLCSASFRDSIPSRTTHTFSGRDRPRSHNVDSWAFSLSSSAFRLRDFETQP